MQLLLDKNCEVTVWDQGIFGLSKGTLESLILTLDKFDFAILLLTPDDMTTSRDETKQSPRDNVLFELGLFVGGLGKNRTYIVYDRTKKIKLPSDLAGITAATFQEHSDGNLEAALGACCTQIENEIMKQGVRINNELNNPSDTANDLPEISVELGRTRKLDNEILELGQGSIIELDKLAGDSVDILFNGKKIAKGEVVVIDKNFGVRVVDIIHPSKR